MANQQKSPFNRVANGYDPDEVAAFAAKALTWKKELASLRSEFETARQQLDRFESLIGTVEVAEKEATEILERASSAAEDLIRQAETDPAKIVQRAELEAAETLHRAEAEAAGFTSPVAQGPFAEPAPPPPSLEESEEDVDLWLTPEPSGEEAADPIEQIFDAVDETPELDPESERELRLAAAAANLWKRRGVLAPPE